MGREGSRVEQPAVDRQISFRHRPVAEGALDSGPAGRRVESLEAPLAWLYRITDNHCLDLLERRRRSSAADLRTHLPATTAAGPGNLERVHVVAQVLAACPERVRRAAVLYYVDEMTQDEVAEALGVSRKTVKEKLARFKEIARGLIGAGLPDEDSSP